MSGPFQKKNFIEFFAGTGLFRAGLERDGWSCEWANDICKDKMNSYVSNFGSEDFHLADIWDICKEPELLPRNVFLATASFPCTDLSVAGGRKGLKGEQSGTLNAFLEILEKQNSIKEAPTVVILENVQGFLTSHNGEDVGYTVKRLNDLGYVVDIVEVDAKYFTAQSRPRVFVIAAKESIAEEFMNIGDVIDNFSLSSESFSSSVLRTPNIQKVMNKFSEYKWGFIDFPPLPEPKANLSEIIEDLNSDSKFWWSDDRKNKLIDQMSEKHLDVLHSMINSPKVSYGTVYRRVRKGISRAELRVDGFAGCLRTPKGGSSKQILVKAGAGKVSVRFLTPREYARLMGLKDDFVLSEKDNSAYFAMGDAVCVPVVEWLSQHALSKVYDLWVQSKFDADAA